MRLAISLPHQQPDGSASTVSQVMDRARLIERIGFDGIWLGDTIGRGSRPRADPLMFLTAAAAATERVELGTAILQVPLRNPVELAQRLLTLHGLSGGRFRAADLGRWEGLRFHARPLRGDPPRPGERDHVEHPGGACRMVAKAISIFWIAWNLSSRMRLAVR